MKIIFHLGWTKNTGKRIFKSAAAGELFTEYVKRVQPFTPCEAAPYYAFDKPKPAGETIWVCDFHSRSKMITSEELAARIETTQLASKILRIIIGGADGFSGSERKIMKPDFVWSFGPLTLPHELAAVVAAEQIYRGWTILRNLPYHSGH